MFNYSIDEKGICHGPCCCCEIDVAHDRNEHGELFYITDTHLLLDGVRVGYIKHGYINGVLTWKYFCLKHLDQIGSISV